MEYSFIGEPLLHYVEIFAVSFGESHVLDELVNLLEDGLRSWGNIVVKLHVALEPILVDSCMGDKSSKGRWQRARQV